MIIVSSSGHHWGVSKKSCQLKNCALANSMPICNRQSSGKFRKRKKRDRARETMRHKKYWKYLHSFYFKVE